MKIARNKPLFLELHVYYHFNASDLFAGTGTGVVFPELSPFLREADDILYALDKIIQYK